MMKSLLRLKYLLVLLSVLTLSTGCSNTSLNESERLELAIETFIVNASYPDQKLKTSPSDTHSLRAGAEFRQRLSFEYLELSYANKEGQQLRVTVVGGDAPSASEIDGLIQALKSGSSVQASGRLPNPLDGVSNIELSPADCQLDYNGETNTLRISAIVSSHIYVAITDFIEGNIKFEADHLSVVGNVWHIAYENDCQIEVNVEASTEYNVLLVEVNSLYSEASEPNADHEQMCASAELARVSYEALGHNISGDVIGGTISRDILPFGEFELQLIVHLSWFPETSVVSIINPGPTLSYENAQTQPEDSQEGAEVESLVDEFPKSDEVGTELQFPGTSDGAEPSEALEFGSCELPDDGKTQAIQPLADSENKTLAAPTTQSTNNTCNRYAHLNCTHRTNIGMMLEQVPVNAAMSADGLNSLRVALELWQRLHGHLPTAKAFLFETMRGILEQGGHSTLVARIDSLLITYSNRPNPGSDALHQVLIEEYVEGSVAEQMHSRLLKLYQLMGAIMDYELYLWAKFKQEPYAICFDVHLAPSLESLTSALVGMENIVANPLGATLSRNIHMAMVPPNQFGGMAQYIDGNPEELFAPIAVGYRVGPESGPALRIDQRARAGFVVQRSRLNSEGSWVNTQTYDWLTSNFQPRMTIQNQSQRTHNLPGLPIYELSQTDWTRFIAQIEGKQALLAQDIDAATWSQYEESIRAAGKDPKELFRKPCLVSSSRRIDENGWEVYQPSCQAMDEPPKMGRIAYQLQSASFFSKINYFHPPSLTSVTRYSNEIPDSMAEIGYITLDLVLTYLSFHIGQAQNVIGAMVLPANSVAKGTVFVANRAASAAKQSPYINIGYYQPKFFGAEPLAISKVGYIFGTYSYMSPAPLSRFIENYQQGQAVGAQSLPAYR